MPVNYLVILPLAAIIADIVLLITLFVKVPRSTQSIILTGLVAAQIVLCAGELSLILMGRNLGGALFAGYFFIGAAVVVAWLILLFALYYPDGFGFMERASARIAVAFLLGAGMFFAVHAYLNFPGVSGIEPESYGYYSIYEISSSAGQEMYMPSLLFLEGMIFAAIANLVLRYRACSNNATKKHILLVIVGSMLIILTGSMTEFILPSLNIHVIGLTGTGMAAMAAVFTYAVLKRRFLTIVPKSEEMSMDAAPLEKGFIYVVGEDEPKKVYEMFADTVKGGAKGLCITTRSPDEIRAKYGLKNTPIILLSGENQSPGTLKPAELMDQRVFDDIRDFVRKYDDTVILLDDPRKIIFDDINVPERRERTLDYMHRASRTIVENNSRLIVPIRRDQLSPVPAEGEENPDEIPVVRTRSPAQFGTVYILNVLLAEKIFNDVAGRIERQDRQALAEEAVRRLRKMFPFFSGARHEKGRIVMDISAKVSKDMLLDMLRTFATVFSDAAETDVSADIAGILEKYGVSRHEFFVQRGSGYIVTERGHGQSDEIFTSFVRAGFTGLRITRSRPGKAVPRGGEPGIETAWLTDTGKGDDVLQPKPEYIRRKIERFLDGNRGKKCIILLEGVEYLITHVEDSFDSTLTLLHILNDLAADANAILLVPADPGAFSPERYRMLSRSLRPVGHV